MFVLPNDATERLTELTGRFKDKLTESKPDLLAAQIYYLALEAQIKVINYLNDDNFYCQVLWDQETQLPSHPSLAADVTKCAEVFKFPSELKTILKSLSGWALLVQQEMKCCCSGKEREVKLEILVNTILKMNRKCLSVKLLAGIKTDDQGHLKNHYNFRKQSQTSDDLYIVLECENFIEVNGDSFEITPNSINCAEQFNLQEFQKRIQGFISLMTRP